MRFLDPLDDLLSSRAKVRILRFLASQPGEHSGREIARAIGMGETPTNRALRSLADTLVVIYRRDGRTHWYRLNEAYALVQEVLLPMFGAESHQLERAVNWLLEGLDGQIQCAVVYGSAARHDQRWASDLDLLLIVPSQRQVESVRQVLTERDLTFLLRCGVVSPQVLTVGDAVRRLTRGEAWLEEALAHGRIVRGELPLHLQRENVA